MFRYRRRFLLRGGWRSVRRAPREMRDVAEVYNRLRAYLRSQNIETRLIAKWMRDVRDTVESAYERQGRFDDAYFSGKSYLDALMRNLGI